MGRGRRITGSSRGEDTGSSGGIDRYLRSGADAPAGAAGSKMAPASLKQGAAARERQEGGNRYACLQTQETEDTAAGQEEEGGHLEGNFSEILKNLPTKQDLERFACRLESSYKKELQALKSEFTSRVEEVEKAQEETLDELQAHRTLLKAHSTILEEILHNQEDAENRNRRNNVRIRGLSEKIPPKDLAKTVQNLFNYILGVDKGPHIELDRVHRALAPRPASDARPRDIICRIHFFTMKEEIMQAARKKGEIIFMDSHIILLPDLARHTLQQ